MILNFPNIKFYEKFEDGHGTAFITGFGLPLDHLTKLWTKYRKIVRENYKISVVANFYSVDHNTTKCLFFLDCAYAEKHNIDKRIYARRFADTFEFWISGFETIIDSIVFDIHHAKMFTEEKKGEITDRVFKNYISAVDKQIIGQAKETQAQIQQLRKERKAHEKAAKAKRVTKALAKKAAQQDQSHRD